MPGLLLAAWIAVVTQLVNAGEPTLRILSGNRIPEGFFQLQIAASKKLAYLVQSSTNLMDWIPLNTNVATGPLAEFVDTAASSYLRRFYRVADSTGGLLLSLSSAKPGETLERSMCFLRLNHCGTTICQRRVWARAPSLWIT